jgi:hypothetical protein
MCAPPGTAHSTGLPCLGGLCGQFPYVLGGKLPQ